MKRIQYLTVKFLFFSLFLTLTPWGVHAEEPQPPKPKEIISKASLQKILNYKSARKGGITSNRHVLLCWSPDDHPHGTHSYEAFAKSFGSTLNKIDKISTTIVKGYPTEKQWKEADLVIFYLTLKPLSAPQLKQIDDHLKRGKSIMAVHQGVVQHHGHDNWSERIGYAFSWENEPGKSKWGKGELTINIDTNHEVFKGFPERVTLQDEFYWNLKKGGRGQITTLGESAAPGSKGTGNDDKWPVFWTVEHPASDPAIKGRVFCSVIGHFDQIQEDPFFRIVLLRAAAWCLNEPFTAFKPAVPRYSSQIDVKE